MSATSIIENLSKEKYNIHMVGITKDGRWLLYRGDPSALADGSWEKDEQNVPAFLSPDSSVHGLLVLHQDGAQVLRLDAVFPALHGKNGEDGTIQGLLDVYKRQVTCSRFLFRVVHDRPLRIKKKKNSSNRSPGNMIHLKTLSLRIGKERFL